MYNTRAMAARPKGTPTVTPAIVAVWQLVESVEAAGVPVAWSVIEAGDAVMINVEA